MSAAPLPVALVEVLVRGDIWRGDTLASLPDRTVSGSHPELDAELRAVRLAGLIGDARCWRTVSGVMLRSTGKSGQFAGMSRQKK